MSSTTPTIKLEHNMTPIKLEHGLGKFRIDPKLVLSNFFKLVDLIGGLGLKKASSKKLLV